MIPTPTPYPPGQMRFVMPEEYNLWGATDIAIQTWNWAGNWGVILQVMLIVLLVVIGVHLLQRFVSQFTRKDAED